VLQRLPALLSVADALPFGRVLLLPPLIQLSLHGLQRAPNVLLRHRRGLRSCHRCCTTGVGMACCGGAAPMIWL
jgi:hypothetical protein